MDARCESYSAGRQHQNLHRLWKKYQPSLWRPAFLRRFPLEGEYEPSWLEAGIPTRGLREKTVTKKGTHPPCWCAQHFLPAVRYCCHHAGPLARESQFRVVEQRWFQSAFSPCIIDGNTVSKSFELLSLHSAYFMNNLLCYTGSVVGLAFGSGSSTTLPAERLVCVKHFPASNNQRSVYTIQPLSLFPSILCPLTKWGMGTHTLSACQSPNKNFSLLSLSLSNFALSLTFFQIGHKNPGYDQPPFPLIASQTPVSLKKKKKIGRKSFPDIQNCNHAATMSPPYHVTVFKATKGLLQPLWSNEFDVLL